MGDPQAIADRFQIEALRGEFTDASMMREGRRPLAVGPVVAVADAGRITEVDFVLDRHKLIRRSAHNKERPHAPVPAVAGAAVRFGPAPVRGDAQAPVTDRSSIRRRS